MKAHLLHSLAETSFDLGIITTCHNGWHTGSVEYMFVEINCHPISL
jgi:hypothetical protein